MTAAVESLHSAGFTNDIIRDTLKKVLLYMIKEDPELSNIIFGV